MSHGASSRCQTCHGESRAGFRQCWRCYLDGERNAAYRQGRADERAERTGVRIDSQMWRRLALLAHPDRHGGSPAAVAAMSWLNSIRGQLQ